MASTGQNDGFHVLNDFVCEAIPASDLPSREHTGRGLNAGMEMHADLILHASLPEVSKERIGELRAMSSDQLLFLVRSSASKLTSQELLAIHDIAAERWTNGDNLPVHGAIELSRETMLVAVRRSA